MNRKLKAVLSALLVVLTLVTSVGLPLCASAATYENDLPIVYVQGRDRTIYNKNGKKIMPFSTDPEDLIMKESDRLLAAFSSSVLQKNWDIYCDELVAVVSEVYKDVTLDNNGEASDGSYVKANATPTAKTSNFGLNDYVFNYDSRLDPWTVAKELRTYINNVLKATGKSKVQLVSRCLGTNYAAAYLTRYKSEAKSKIDTCVLYVPSAKGTIMVSESFSGEFKFDPDLINTYVNEYMEDSEMTELLKAVVSVTYSMSILSLGTNAVESVYQQIADRVVPELILATYGTMPSYWSMVDDEHYDKAKSLVLSGKEEEYAGLIEKIDRYHNKVMINLDSTLLSLRNSGMKVAIIAKYNTALAPLFESSNVQADGLVELSSLSFGATAADMGKTLSKAYLDDVSLSGAIDYVSDDLIIDSSTCLFPDNTWFIKDSPHGAFKSSMNNLILTIVRQKKQMTVWDNEKYPQYLQYNSNNTLTPISAATPGDGAESSGGSTNILSTIINFFSKIINVIKSLLGIGK
ncbi:MAG: hypothetical protein IJ491_07895 [Clostridia bacterium]|nr:hypothetical protein [Clostridia bacterium]